MTKQTLKKLGGLTLGLALMGNLSAGAFAAEAQAKEMSATETTPSTFAIEMSKVEIDKSKALELTLASPLKPEAGCDKCTAFIALDDQARNQFIDDNKDENGVTTVCDHIVFADTITASIASLEAVEAADAIAFTPIEQAK